MTPQPEYNYMVLFRAVCVVVALAVPVIIVLNDPIRLALWRQQLRAWWRAQRGDILPVAGLALCALVGWLYVWAWWILTHEVR